MIVFKPKRRVCKGKNVQFAITDLDPFNWLQVTSAQYVSFFIDGFIVSSEKKIKAVFNKYEYEGDENIDDIISYLKDHFSQEILACASFAEILNTEYRIFIWPKDYPENYDVEEELIISIKPIITNDIVDLSSYKKVNIKSLESGIYKLRGYNFSNGKSLLTANSNVECYLANNTSNPWPGDLDALFYLIEEKKIIALIEFKTHNKATPIEEEYIGKYGNEDWRRFDVLYSLQAEIEKKQGLKPKLLYIVWGTQDIEKHKMIKIDSIVNNKIEFTNYLDRPEFGLPSKDLFNYIIKVCK